jgi:hypothetical protein
MAFLPSYIYIIALSFFISLSAFDKKRNSYLYLKTFPLFLLATLIAESLGSYLYSIHQDNVYIYNFFTVFEFCFYLWVIRCIIINIRIKTIITVSIVLYVAVAVINILFILKPGNFHATTYSVGCLLIVIFCSYYFFELFKFPKSDKLQYNPAFWICSGLLFFYCCGFPLYALINLWGDISNLMVENFTRIVTILNIFLYSLFTIAFICNRRKKYIL